MQSNSIRSMDATRCVLHRFRLTTARTSSFALLLLLVLAACSTNPRQPGPAAEEATTVRVENNAWADMTVYAIADGQRVRLGSVTGNTTRVLRIPARVIGLGRNISFMADPVGSDRAATSFQLFVWPGEEITITIPAQAG